MPTIELDNAEFNGLMFVLANAEGKGITWAVINPLLMKLGNQARLQAEAEQKQSFVPAGGDRELFRHGNSKEVIHD